MTANTNKKLRTTHKITITFTIENELEKLVINQYKGIPTTLMLGILDRAKYHVLTQSLVINEKNEPLTNI